METEIWGAEVCVLWGGAADRATWVMEGVPSSTLRWKDRAAAWVLWTVELTFPLIYYLVQTSPRYRYPIYWVSLLGSVYAVSRLLRRRRGASATRDSSGPVSHLRESVLQYLRRTTSAGVAYDDKSGPVERVLPPRRAHGVERGLAKSFGFIGRAGGGEAAMEVDHEVAGGG